MIEVVLQSSKHTGNIYDWEEFERKCYDEWFENNNIKCEYNIQPIWHGFNLHSLYRTFLFEKEEDAVAFKIVWDN